MSINAPSSGSPKDGFGEPFFLSPDPTGLNRVPGDTPEGGSPGPDIPSGSRRRTHFRPSRNSHGGRMPGKGQTVFRMARWGSKPKTDREDGDWQKIIPGLKSRGGKDDNPEDSGSANDPENRG